MQDLFDPRNQRKKSAAGASAVDADADADAASEVTLHYRKYHYHLLECFPATRRVKMNQHLVSTYQHLFSR